MPTEQEFYKARQVLMEARSNFLNEGKRPYSAKCGKKLYDAALLLDPRCLGKIYGMYIVEAEESAQDWDVQILAITDREAMTQVASWLYNLNPWQLSFFMGALMGEYINHPDRSFWNLVIGIRSTLKEEGPR